MKTVPLPLWSTLGLGILVLGLILSNGRGSLFAQTVTTNITSSGLGTTVTPDGTTTDITGGTRPSNGTNLFHSFGSFTVGSGNTANFQNETGRPTENIISRVTGGTVSNIFGTLKTTNFSQANLWLINPAGVMFGSTASLNIGGAFHVSTADYVSFTNGAQFFVNVTKTSTLTSAPIAAFGFLNPQGPQGISVSGSGTRLSTLSPASGKALSLVGGDITISKGELVSPQGDVNLVSVGLPTNPTETKGGEVQSTSFASQPFQATGFQSLGNIEISESIVGQNRFPNSVIPSGSGSVYIQGGQIHLTGRSNVSATDTIHVTGKTFLLDEDPALLPTPFGSPPTKIEATSLEFQTLDSLTLDGTNGIADLESGRFTGIQGGSGGINLDQVQEIHLIDQSIFDPNSGSLSGANLRTINGGQIAIANGSLLDIDHGSISGGDITISSLTTVNLQGTSRQAASLGSGGLEESIAPFVNGSLSTGQGNIQFQGINHVTIDGGLLSTATETSNQGGTISFQDIGNMSVNGVITSNTGNSATLTDPNAVAGSGNAGSVTFLNVGTLLVESTGQISSRTKGGSGDAGSLEFSDISVLTHRGRISASSTSLNPDAAAGNIILDNIGFFNVDGGQVNSRTLGNGPAGTITMTNINSLTVQNQGVIRTNTTGPGQAGAISIGTTSAGKETFSSQSSQARLAYEQSLPGSTPHAIILTQDGRIESKSALAAGTTDEDTPIGGGFDSFRNDPAQLGNAGTITLTTQNLSLADRSQIQSSTEGTGSGGTITLNLDLLAAQHDALLASTTSGTGNAGNIVVQGQQGKGHRAKEITLQGHAEILSDTLGLGAGGQISMNSDIVQLTGDAEIASDVNTGGTGNGGTIAIQARRLTLDGNPEISSDTEDGSTGKGGQVQITADEEITFTIPTTSGSLNNDTEAGIFTNSAGTGDAGSISIIAPAVTLDGGVITARTERSGAGGQINIQAGQLTLSQGASISSESTSQNATAGGSGGIAITATDGIELNTANLLASVEGGNQTAGNIALETAGDITINDSQISGKSEGLGDAGDITLTSDGDLLLTDTQIQTSATLASGGNIKLTAPDQVLLNNTQITSSVNGPVGSNGGNISIDPQFVVLANGSQILAQAVGGNGGNINIVTDTYLADMSTLVDASSQLGISGNITIDSPVQNLSGALSPLPKNFAQITNLFAQRCARTSQGRTSSLVQGSRDALPAQPGTALHSPLLSSSQLLAPSLSTEDSRPSPHILRLGLSRLTESLHFLTTQDQSRCSS